MTLDGILFALLSIALLMNWPVAAILVRAAWKRPRIKALTFSAALSVVIALAVTLYVLTVANYSAQVVPDEAMRVVLRFVLLLVALWPLGFLYAYVTGRFRDGVG